MRKMGVRGVLVAVVLMAAGDGAYAATVNVDCSSNPGALAAQFGGATPGGTANTTYAITGTCHGNFSITQDNITIEASGYGATITGGAAGGPAVGISGASNIILQDLAILGAGSYEAVYIVGPASVTIRSDRWTSTIGNAVYGVYVEGPASVYILGTTIQNTGSVTRPFGAGVFASGPSRVFLGPAGVVGGFNVGTSISPNQGIGIDAFEGAMIELSINVQVSSGPSSPAIQVRQSSSVIVAGGEADTATYVTGPASNHTILASHGSTVTLQSARVTADTPFDATNQWAVITATDSSSVILAGGNIITNSAPGGAAVMVSGGSSFKVSNATDFLGDSVFPGDTINGDGRVNTQSVIELGAAAGGGGITWNGNVVVSQFSSFRADGDNVTITGTLSLGQAGNAYFNQTQGTSNAVAHVVCQSTTDHVANPTLVTPNVMIGNPPNCASF